MRGYLTALSILIFMAGLNAQVSGLITSSTGDTLPYATIYIEGTTNGTTSNADGFFEIEVLDEEAVLVAQYVGFKTEKKLVNKSDLPLRLDFVLEVESVNITEITIAADAEDPAYGIIRKAIQKRDYYKDIIPEYTSDLYIKGLVRFVESPDKFMGQEIGDMGGVLDTAGSGIVYLSESRSKLYFKAPGKIKEEMYASKVSGELEGISFNQFSSANFNFYYEHFSFGRSLITPLADNALRHYNYKLLGTTYDTDGRLLNKIKVSPKGENTPGMFGTLYIIEDSWNIHSLDLGFTGKSAKEPIFDTIRIRQHYVLLKEPDQWGMLSQVVDFSMGTFGFKLGGAFSYIFNDYEIQPNFTEKTFGNEVFRIEEGADMQDTNYWREIRPIPLTKAEALDYTKKDSLRGIWESKSFMDSVDRESNKFNLMDIASGYTYRNSYKRFSVNVQSPLSTYRFNPVEGSVLSSGIGFRSENKKETKYWEIGTDVSYGFADKKLKGELKIERKFNSLHQGYLGLEAGRRYAQYDAYNPVMPMINTYASLLYKRNYLKLYQKDFLRLSYQRELVNSLYLWAETSYSDNRVLENQSDYSWFKKSRTYESNHPLGFTDITPIMVDHQSLEARVSLRWRPGQKYMSMGNFRARIPSDWPSFILRYKKALPVLDTDQDFDFVSLQIIDSNLDLKLAGHLAYNVEFGGFLNDKTVYFPNFKHFHGNRQGVKFMNQALTSFRLLHEYTFSTTDDYGMAHIAYHLDGILMDRIPFLRDLGIKSVLRFSSFYQTKDVNYFETSFGIEGIKIAGLDFFTIDYSFGFYSGKKVDQGLSIGILKMMN